MAIERYKGYSIILILIVTGCLFWEILPSFSLVSASVPFYITGVFCFFLGRRWNTRVIKTDLNSETVKKTNLRKVHSFMFIKMQYWSLFFIAISVMLLSKQGSKATETIQSILIIFFFISLIYTFRELSKTSKYKKYFSVIWSGKGYLVILLWFLTFVTLALFFEQYLSRYGFIIPFCFTGLVCLIFGLQWNRKKKNPLTDHQTNKKLSFVSNHSFLLIKIQYWGILFISLAVLYSIFPPREREYRSRHKGDFHFFPKHLIPS